jgi:hypothetical protein
MASVVETASVHSIELRSGQGSLQSRARDRTTGGARDDIDATSATIVTINQASVIADSEVPDGGYGWTVVAGSAVITFWYIGVSYSWGVIQAALVNSGLSTASTLSFVGSLMPAGISFLGVLNATIIRKIGARAAAALGVSFFGAGEILSSFTVHNIGGMFVTAGVIMGIGLR